MGCPFFNAPFTEDLKSQLTEPLLWLLRNLKMSVPMAG